MPTVTIDLPELTRRRTALLAARTALAKARFEFEDATKAFKEAKRLFAPGDATYDDAKNRLDAAVLALHGVNGNDLTDGAVKAEAGAYEDLNDGINSWLSDTPNERFLTVDEDITRLNQIYPIVMFPIRIETRFDGTRFKVRIYPDEIFQNRMEYPLTPEERDAGKKYWEDFNQLDHEEDRWREIIQQFTPERSAHIVRFMKPTNFPTTSDPDFPCSEKLQGGQKISLTFPADVPLRAAAWTRPAEAILPDRWVLVTYRNGVRKVTVGAPIVEPLAMSTDPSLPESQQSQISSNQDYKIDDKLRWTVDFTRAQAVGMAIEIGLDADESAIGTGGFDRVLVFGVKTSMESSFTTFTLGQLFDAHHHTRGLAFVRQGSPTNNTKGNPTEFPPDDEDGSRSFRIEREHPPATSQFFNDCLPPDSDGAALGLTLALPNGIFSNVDRTMEHEILRAKSMNRALWPLTYGYFMKVLMDPIFSDADIARAKDYAYNYVRPRGVAPAFRVGEVPYGVLPATSIYRWQTSLTDPNSDEFAVTSKIIDPLRRLVSIWLDASVDVPKVTGSATDPNVELMTILSTYPSTKEIRVRHGVGLVTWYNIFNFFGWSFSLVNLRLNALTEALFRRVGHPEWRPRIGGVIFDSRAWRLIFPLVADNPLEQTVQATQDFINGIKTATVQQLKDNTFNGVPPNFSFLYSLLRHATLAEYARITDEFLAAVRWKEPELNGFPSQPASPTIVQEALQQIASAFDAKIAPHKAALGELALATDAELDRLLGETLDFASHRLDAWVTGVATQRLANMRIAREGGPGQYLGGYAWVENLRPVQRSTKTVDNVQYEIQPGTGGFIHTPSMTHAAAAAILRSAHISHRSEDPQKFAVDLSSRRVRNARRVLDEVRAGQPLGAVLGYRFERGLHEGHTGVLDLDVIRFKLRNRFPLVAGKNGSDTTELAENIAARNVVDGLALLRAYHGSAFNPFSDPDIPQTDQAGAVKDELDKMGELNDAVADLLMAESAYQLARGNLVGAPGSLTNAGRGRPPPDPAVAHSARTGIGLAHRVALVFSKDHSLELSSAWPAPTPRALAEPALDVWLGRIIGDPTNVTCKVTFTEAPGSVTVKLSDLGLRSLDVLALARVAAEKGLGSVLDARVLTAALGSDTTKTNVTIEYGPQAGRHPKSDRTFPEVLELARALGAALGGGRPLEIGDLLSPTEVDRIVADTDTETTAAADAEDIRSRANNALTALDEVTNSTTVTADKSLALAILVGNPASPTPNEIQNLQAALTVAAKFAPERAFPPHPASGPELLSLAKAVQKEFTRRLKVADDQHLPLAVASKDITARAIEVLKAIFGNDFVALPTLHVPRSDEIDESFDARTDLIGLDDKELTAYYQQATRARANLRRFNKFSIYSRALGQAPLSLNVAQLPLVEGEQWLGRRLGNVLPKEGRAAILFLSEEDVPDTEAIWRGVLLEQWTEVIPKTQEQTAIAMHFDTPRAAAPQSILVAVPSRMDMPWQFEDIVAILNETLDLAKVRAVDGELLPLGQALPAAIVAQNDALDVTFATLYSAFVGAPSVEAFQGFS